MADSLGDSAVPLEGGALKQYTFVEKETVTKLDSKGKPSTIETNLYHVTQGNELWQYYRKHFSRNGVPLSTAELEKQDREQKKREEKGQKELAQAIEEAQKAAQKRKDKPPPTPPVSREEREKMNDNTMFEYCKSIYDIEVVRREVIDGRNNYLISMKPKAKSKAADDLAKLLQHVALRGWVTDQHQVMRVEADVTDSISFGFGLLAKIKEGTQLVMDRRPIGESLWAPSRVETILNAKILLFKGLSERQVSEYSDFKKYTVESQLRVIETAQSSPD